MLALLPTATENILAEMQTERITYELQQQKAAKLARTSDGPSGSTSELLNSEPPSVTDDDGRSMVSLTSESGLHASRMGMSGAQTGDGPQDGGSQAQKARRTKLQLWNDLKISCEFRLNILDSLDMCLAWANSEYSDHEGLYVDLYLSLADATYPRPAEPFGAKKLLVERGIISDRTR